MLTLDVGNSSVGVGVWRDEQVALRRLGDVAELPALLAELEPCEVVGIDVAPARWTAVAAALGAAGWPAPRALSEPPLPLADPRLAGSAGADRLANALAVAPGPAVAVDAGTAVTLDLVDGAGTYLGGYIAPGPRAALAGVSAATAALPALDGAPVPLRPGLDTQSALSAGGWGLVVGGLDRLVDEARAALGGDARVVVTGGWGAAWCRDSRHAGLVWDAELIHRGIRRWARV